MVLLLPSDALITGMVDPGMARPLRACAVCAIIALKATLVFDVPLGQAEFGATGATKVPWLAPEQGSVPSKKLAAGIAPPIEPVSIMPRPSDPSDSDCPPAHRSISAISGSVPASGAENALPNGSTLAWFGTVVSPVTSVTRRLFVLLPSCLAKLTGSEASTTDW